MISLQKHKQHDKARALKNAVMGVDGIAQNPKGTEIEYHVGDWADLIGLTAVGKQAMDLYKLGLVSLVHRGPVGGPYSYLAVTR
jgi:ribosomal 30S subunit maturation factor RimM